MAREGTTPADGLLSSRGAGYVARITALEDALRRRVGECGCGEESDGTWCVWCAEDAELLDV